MIEQSLLEYARGELLLEKSRYGKSSAQDSKVLLIIPLEKRSYGANEEERNITSDLEHSSISKKIKDISQNT